MAQGQRGSGDVVHLDTLLLSNAQLLSSSFDSREEKALGSDQVGEPCPILSFNAYLKWNVLARLLYKKIP